ncbi:cell surface protein precursor, LPXTG-motif cell wall anchor [Planoprotostelium fungivorum]|uniref:Cell surface protein, LPXTG-motif cell wall anchor n=1 Tax=Planoprotostelium fungivorum TaxID=1890364 RepID=A0A2P6N5F0_9EUKA|nr:cell surface protein precursor, LPXTG-motif cell wall anchor [Planoprotostelium fungivorum]
MELSNVIVVTIESNSLKGERSQFTWNCFCLDRMLIVERIVEPGKGTKGQIFTPDAVRSVDLTDRLCPDRGLQLTLRGTLPHHFPLLAIWDSFVERPYELNRIIFTRLSNMKSILFILLLFVFTLGHAQDHLTLSIVSQTGFFSPVYTARSSVAYFTAESTAAIFSDFEPVRCVALCDGKVSPRSSICHSYQLVVYAPDSAQDLLLDLPIDITVTNADIIDVTVGVGAYAEAPSYLRFTSLEPYFFAFDFELEYGLPLRTSFSEALLVKAGTFMQNPLYLQPTETFRSFEVEVNSTNSFTFEGDHISGVIPQICATNDITYLLKDGSSIEVLQKFSCVKLGVQSATNYTLVSVQTPPTLVISSSGDFAAPCTTFGSSVDRYALIKFNATDLIGQAYLNGSYYDFDLTRAFDLAIKCGVQAEVTVSAVISPGENVLPWEDQLTVIVEEVLLVNSLDTFTKITKPVTQLIIPPGIIGIGQYEDPLERAVGRQSCTNANLTINYGGNLGFFLSACHTVSSDSIIYVNSIQQTIVLRPPSRHCLKIDGLPRNAEINFVNAVTYTYNSSDTIFSAITCSDDILDISIAPPNTQINITLVKISCQATYGQTYDIDDLAIFQYPPILTDIAVRSFNVTGTASAPPIVPPLYRAQNSPFSNRLFDQSASRAIVVAIGRGQLTTNLGTSDGVNTGFDEAYQSLDDCPLSPPTMTSSEMASTSSSVVDSTADSSFADDSTSIDETTSEVDASSPSTLANIKSSSSVSITSSVDKSSVTDDNTGFVVRGTFYDATTSTNSLTSDASAINISVLSIAITMIISILMWTNG